MKEISIVPMSNFTISWEKFESVSFLCVIPTKIAWNFGKGIFQNVNNMFITPIKITIFF